jgi:hypothetical protein
MKQILLPLIVGLTLSLTGWSAENLSNVFSKELAQTKKEGNNATLINALDVSPHVVYRSAGLQRMLDSKEFKEFAKDNKVTIINMRRQVVVTGEMRKNAVENARKILGNNAPITYEDWVSTMSNWRGWSSLNASQKDAHIKKLMSDPLPRHYVNIALKNVVNKERVKKVTLMKVFNGEFPSTLLLDSKGNVLNKTVFKRGMTVKDYIEKYTEILVPEEEENDSKNKDKAAK